MSPFQTLFATLVCALLGAVAMWRLSVRLRDASVVDVFWGYGFAVIGILAYAAAPAATLRSTILLAATLLWSLRLGTHMWWRSRGRAEDFRYAELRRFHGEAFAQRSLTRVFLFQATIQWLLSLPLQVALLWPGARAIELVDLLGIAVFGVGWTIEAAADFQLERFRRDESTRGRVLDRGLWRYSRHPNYFGECLIAWGLFALASRTPYGPWFVWSPLLLTFLLMRVTGVPYLERGLVARIPGYAEYVRRTPAFVPGRPRRAQREEFEGVGSGSSPDDH